MTAGGVSLEAHSGGVAVADDGSLEGVLEASLRDGNRLFAVAQTGKPPPVDPTATATARDLRLTFRDGSTWIGSVRLAPAPRVY